MSDARRAPVPLIQVDDDFEEEFPGAHARATECYANLVRTGNLLIGLHDKQVWDEHRLSGTAKQALAILDGAAGPLEPSVIAERLIITTGSMTSMLDTLEKAGLVVRRRHPDDRRKLLVDITDEGIAIVDGMLPSLHARERVIVGDALSEHEQQQLLRLLAKVQQSIRDHADDPPDHDAVRVRLPRHRQTSTSAGNNV